MVGAFLLASCLSNPGGAPPEGQIGFPTGIASDDAAAPQHLYVLSSNFDLRYNAAALQGYDLDLLEQAIQTRCVAPRAGLTEQECQDAAGCAVPEDCVIIPEELEGQVDDEGGTLVVAPISGLLVSEVLLGSYGSSLTVSPDGSRIYASIRSDANITYIDRAADGSLDCGGTDARHRCAASFRAADVENAAARGLSLPADPVDMHVGLVSDLTPGGTGNFLLMAHRAGRVSYFIDEGAGPELIDSRDGFVPELATITFGPDGVAWMPSQRSLFVARAGVTLAGLAGEDPKDALVYDAGTVGIRRVDTGAGDFREVKFDNTGRAVLLSRIPAAVVTADPTPLADGSLDIEDVIEVGAGPSRLVLGTIAGREHAFVSCFDSRDIYVVDLTLHSVSAVIRGMSGPFEMVVDPLRERLYVADFRTSAVRIVDLSPLATCLGGSGVADRECAPELLGVLGRPRAAEEVR